MNKRDDILQAAERLFYTNGFHATSTDQLCREAGVSTRTLYHHFASREALTLSVMAARRARFFGDLLPAQHPQALRRLFETLGEWTEQYGAQGCFFIKAWGEYAEKEPMLAAHALDYRYALRRYIGDCVPDERMANAVWMLFEGAVISALMLGPDAAKHAGDAAERLLLSREEQS